MNKAIALLAVWFIANPVSIRCASFTCSLTISNSDANGAMEDVVVDLSCADTPGTSSPSALQPIVRWDSSLDSSKLSLTGVEPQLAEAPNTRGLLTFEGNYSLIFTQIALTNIQLPTVGAVDRSAHSLTSADPPLMGSVVWFETIGNVTISNWSNDGSSAPVPAGFGTLMFNSSEDHIQESIFIHDSHVVCSPFCFTMAGASDSLAFDNCIFESAFTEETRRTVTLTTAVWANLTGVLEVTNCQFNGFGTEYGSLSVFATNVTINNCSFHNNVAKTAGAGLYITGTGNWQALGPKPHLAQGWSSTAAAQGGWVWVQDSTFTQNNVLGSGGGGMNIVNMGNIMINGCTFQENTAFGDDLYHGNGAAIHILGTLRQDANIFINNSVISENVGQCNVLLESVRCVGVKDTLVENNQGIGMCIHYVGGGCSFQDPIWNFDNCQGNCGPMPFNFDSIGMPTNLSAEIAQFAQFSAYGSFTALYTNSSSSSNSKFWSGDLAGEVQASQDLCVDIRTSTFRNNSVQPQNNSRPYVGGAGLEIKTAQPIIIADSLFEGNSGRQGSGLHLDACPSTLVWNTTFDGNTAEFEGGAVALVNSNGQGLLLGDCNLTNNAGSSGGAVYGSSGANLLMAYGTSLSNNEATTGGAIHCDACQQLTMTTKAVVHSNTAQQGGGAYCNQCECVLFQDIIFQNNKANDSGGAVYVNSNGVTLTSVTLVWVNQSSFVQNTAGTKMQPDNPMSMSGGAWTLEGGVNKFMNNTFNGNTAWGTGGAIAYSYLCFTGGNLRWAYLDQEAADSSYSCSTMTHSANSYIGNTATFAGGVLFSNDINSSRLTCNSGTTASNNQLECDSPVWQDNSVGAQGYGPGLAFPPQQILVQRDQFQSYVSDGTGKLNMTITVVDAANTTVTSGSSATGSRQLRAQLQVYSTSMQAHQPRLSGQTEASTDVNSSSLGIISIREVMLTAAPGDYYINVTLPDYPQVTAHRIPVLVRECMKGEVQPTPVTCMTCPAATYSFSPNETICENHCPSNAECHGGAVLVPQLGFWHSAADSTYMAQCPNADACAGDRAALMTCQSQTYAPPDITGHTQGPPVNCSVDTPMDSEDPTSYMRQQCAPGYYGPLCSMCMREGPEPYGMTSTWTCQRCRSKAAIIVAFAASNLLVLAFLYYSIHATLKDNEEEVANMRNKVKASELTRALTLWLQYISMVGSVNIPAPDSITWPFAATKFAFSSITSGALSTDCLISAASGINPALKRLILRLAVPWFTLVILMVAQILRWLQQRRSAINRQAVALPPAQLPPRGPVVSAFAAEAQLPTAAALAQHDAGPDVGKAEEIKRRLLVTLLVVAFYYYPSLVTAALSFFACYSVDRIGPGSSVAHPQNCRATWHQGYWLSDMTVECFTGKHLRWSGFIGIPLLLLTGLGIPLVSLGVLLYHRKALDDTSVLLRYGFLYRPYRKGLWCWDIVILMQTFALSAALVFATTLNSYFQLTIMLLILIVGLTVLAHVCPFAEALSQKVQVLGLFTVVATTTGCLYFVDPTGIAKQRGIQATGILLMILNAFFLLVMGLLIAKAGALDLMLHVQQGIYKARKLADKVFSKLCGCGKGKRATYGASPVAHGANGRRPGRPTSLELSPSWKQFERPERRLSTTSRGSSTELLRNNVFSSSGRILETGDSMFDAK